MLGSRSTCMICVATAVMFYVYRVILLHMIDVEHVGSIAPTYPNIDHASKPNGVFVFKVSTTKGLEKTLCTLTTFFNGNAKYPIRIFADHATENDNYIGNFTGDADIEIIVQERWKSFPPTLTQEQVRKVQERCTDLNDPEKARCTNRKVSLGYVFNTYWSYMEMADEPALKDFDYFVLFDDDSFLTKPMPDPFQIMQDNDLVGIYNIESMEAGLTGGIQEAVDASFSKEERRNAFLDSSPFSTFDHRGVWGGDDPRKPGVWMCFYGGRLDFLRSPKFKDFAQRLPFHTYMTRTSRQAVIPIGWSILAGGSRVWYLPKRGIEMGVYHHGWVDDSEVIRGGDDKGYTKHTLQRWNNFTESKITTLVKWKEYMELTEHQFDGTMDWQQCIAATGRKYGSK